MSHDDASLSCALYRRGARVIPGGNTRSAVFFPPFPRYVASGRGAYATDVDGVERIDFVNCNSATIHGHNPPKVVAAVVEQAQRLLCVGTPTVNEIELAERLVDRVPGIEQVRFANSGTEALMFAVRAARAVTGRRCIARAEGAYHGSYDDLYVSVRPTPVNWGRPEAPASIPGSEGLSPSVVDEVLVLPFNDVASTLALLERHARDVAAVVLDPCPAYLGFTPATKEYLLAVREATTRLGIVLIFDEVICFRLGRSGAQGYFNVVPDLTVLGKLIGGGLPVGAIGGRRDFMAVFDHSHGHARVDISGTFSGNPMTMAAGIAALDLLDQPAFAHLRALGTSLRTGMTAALADVGINGQVRGLESMALLQFSTGPISNYRDLYALSATPGAMPRAHWMHQYLLDHGVQMIQAGGFFLSTVMTAEDITRTVHTIHDGLRAMARVPAHMFEVEAA